MSGYSGRFNTLKFFTAHPFENAHSLARRISGSALLCRHTGGARSPEDSAALPGWLVLGAGRPIFVIITEGCTIDGTMRKNGRDEEGK